jgi:hypothetical protein
MKERRVSKVQTTHRKGQTFLSATVDEIQDANLRRRLAERVRSGKGVDRGEALLKAIRSWDR